MVCCSKPVIDGSFRETVFREIDHFVVKVDPFIMLRLYVHCKVIVEKMKGETKHAAFALIPEVKWRSLTKGRQQRITGRLQAPNQQNALSVQNGSSPSSLSIPNTKLVCT